MYKTHIDTEHSVVTVRGTGSRGGGGGQRRDKLGRRETLLGAMGTRCSVQVMFCWVVT